jgi:signal transduction histidine kinase
VDFLFHLLDHTIPLLDNIRLVNRLVSDAAEMERQRIARNLHDSVLQPCVGLRLGLAAAMGKFCLAGTHAGKEIEQVIKLSDAAIADLRRYIDELHHGDTPEGDLLPVLQGFAKQFSAVTGIAVHVEAEGGMCLNDRLAAEVLQMVAEGLSNVRRHTYSTWATVGLVCHDGHLSVQIKNDGTVDKSPIPFTPRSIAERAAAIGGQTRVEGTDTGRTVVLIDIPL